MRTRKHIILFFMCAGFLCSQSLCMKKIKITRGQKVFGHLVGYIKSKKNDKEKFSVIKLSSSNIIDYCLYKAENSKDEIFKEVANVAGKFIALLGKGLFSSVFNLKGMKNKSKEIKSSMEKILERESSKNKYKDAKEYLWFNKDLKFVRKLKNEKEKRGIYIDMLSIASFMAATEDKGKFFKKHTDTAVVKYWFIPSFAYNAFYDILYNTIRDNMHTLEEKIVKSCTPKKMKKNLLKKN
ncbi:hypothetical protein ACFLYU_02020 [Candidatus Dependentiae bacterium]